MAKIFMELPFTGVIQNTFGVPLFLEKVSAESIPSHTPIAIINNLAYKLDSSKPEHQFAFTGFSLNGSSQGQVCKIQERGEIFLTGWNLISNVNYLSGINGTLIQDNLSNTNFTKIIAYATSSNSLRIINDYTTINK